MSRFVNFANELVLGAFFVAILAVATITTMGLSPGPLNKTNAVLTPAEVQVLGISTDKENFDLTLADNASGADVKYQSESGYYIYNESLPALNKGNYQKAFVTIDNRTTAVQEWQIIPKIPTQYNDSVTVSVVDPAGNSTSLTGDRKLTVPASSRVSYTIHYDLTQNLGFSLPINIVLAPLQ